MRSIVAAAAAAVVAGEVAFAVDVELVETVAAAVVTRVRLRATCSSGTKTTKTITTISTWKSLYLASENEPRD